MPPQQLPPCLHRWERHSALTHGQLGWDKGGPRKAGRLVKSSRCYRAAVLGAHGSPAQSAWAAPAGALRPLSPALPSASFIHPGPSSALVPVTASGSHTGENLGSLFERLHSWEQIRTDGVIHRPKQAQDKQFFCAVNHSVPLAAQHTDLLGTFGTTSGSACQLQGGTKSTAWYVTGTSLSAEAAKRL